MSEIEALRNYNALMNAKVRQRDEEDKPGVQPSVSPRKIAVPLEEPK